MALLPVWYSVNGVKQPAHKSKPILAMWIFMPGAIFLISFWSGRALGWHSIFHKISSLLLFIQLLKRGAITFSAIYIHVQSLERRVNDSLSQRPLFNYKKNKIFQVKPWFWSLSHNWIDNRVRKIACLNPSWICSTTVQCT